MNKQMLCPRCGNEIELDYYALCMTCYQEIGLYGDEENKRFWFAVKNLVNAEPTYEELEILSDSPPFLKLMIDVLSVKKDLKAFKNFLIKVDKKIKGE